MITNLFSENLGLTAIFVFLLSFSVAYFALPSVIYVVKQKNLMDNPNERSSHKEKTPTLGGISFFVSIVFTLMVFRPFDIDQVGINILSGVGVLFFVGLKDDLVGVKPSTKIIGQIIATLMLFFSTDLKITTLDGFLNITDIPYWTSVFISCAIVMAIVNSYNLIDGINGSASMVGMVIFSAFAYVFYDAEMYYYFLLSILCMGFLLAFLRYNLSNKNRVFMGDTGSMIVGFVLAVLAIKFFALDTTSLESAIINPTNKVWVLLSIIFIPFFDTTRVFTTRIIRHGKPFKADRSHIHHVIIDYLKLSHAKASILLASINLSVFIVILYLNTYLSSLWLGVLLTSIFIILSALLFYVNRSYHSLKSKQKVRHFINGINNL
ncbi:MraY family glycosyltransferase [Capnocytophaga leadbetteri]|uniref:glycosyltransferase family 4 protein n=1 Tax=Capnocytophaga leadbetteri TaxID=327575 RepID=UPI0028E53AA0|nr:MraY family glycosyltransferase [Capnocytophaga leadbetteri]